ncbi:MAG: serine--tRNA ligase [Oscillospiraceae bacterium]|nr:serine--tRNA ligase [Oscillospiraceae bacterium]
MIDQNLVLKDKEAVKRSIARKGYDVGNIDKLEEALIAMKKAKTELDELRAKRNAWNKDRNISVDDKRALRDEIAEKEKALGELEDACKELLWDIPNFPDEDAPEGKDENDNVVVQECTDYYKSPVEEHKPHWELGKELGILDNEAASKISGAMFALYKGKGSQLLRALVSYGLKLHGEKYLEVTPPHMVSSQTLMYTGHLPKFSAEQYKASLDDLWLIPTAEVPLTGCFANETFKAGELPQYRCGYTVCFRREAGSAGKDTRGLQRVHEFHKVELVKVCEPQMKDKELSDLLADCLKIIQDLKLQYRVVDLCTGDMGDKYGRCYDIEVYAPGAKRWLEVSSVGHFSDYQARRANIKYITAEGKREVAYTLNGSGIATPRVLAAIIETYQQPDGSVIVPEVLRPYLGCDVIR